MIRLIKTDYLKFEEEVEKHSKTEFSESNPNDIGVSHVIRRDIRGFHAFHAVDDANTGQKMPKNSRMVEYGQRKTLNLIGV